MWIQILEVTRSLRTTIWLILTLLCFLFYGSVVMPLTKEFQTLHSTPLFQWMTENSPGITWWLWAILVILSLLSANTLICSIESVVRKKSARQWALVISPQLVHIGFLFILLAHLLSAYGSFRGTAVVQENAGFKLPGGTGVLFRNIHVEPDQTGYARDWSADLEFIREGRSIRTDRIRPNNPSFQDGLGIYIKNAQLQPYPAALIEVSREPGAPWALVGSLFFLAGMVMLLIFKTRREN
jgi:cytochrome c biogenesis protein ResB